MKQPRVVVVSFMKSGRTWLKVIHEAYLHKVRYEGLKPDELVKWTHLGFGNLEDTNVKRFYPAYDQLPVCKGFEEWREKFPKTPLVLLRRDPADVMTSLWHDERVRNQHRTKEYDNIDAFVEGTSIRLNRFAASAQEMGLKFEYKLSYEQMQRDTFRAIKPVFDLIHNGKTNDDALRSAIEKCEFDTLSKKERKGQVDMRVAERFKKNGFYKTRKGKVGSADEELREGLADTIREQYSAIQKL